MVSKDDVILVKTNAIYGYWLNPQQLLLRQHTHTGQARSRALCFLAAVFMSVPIVAVITGFLQSQACVTRLGSI